MLTILQHTVSHFNTTQHTATHCITLQHISKEMLLAWQECAVFHDGLVSRDVPQHTATHCNTLQHTATLCNTFLKKYCWHGSNARYFTTVSSIEMLVDRELVEGVVREQKYAKCQKAIDMLFTMNFYMQQVASVLQRMVVCCSVSQHVTTTSANKVYATS